MFGRKERKAKASEYDFDLDLDLDWDMDDPGNGEGTDGAKNRKPVVQNSLDFGKGVAKSFAEPSNIKQFIRNMLPNEYGQYIDTFDEAKMSVSGELQDIRSSLSGTSRALKSSTNKVVSLAEQNMPGKLAKALGKLKTEEEDNYDYDSRDPRQDRDSQIDSTLGQLFGAQEQIRQKERKIDSKKEVIQQALDNRRHQVSSGLMSNIDATGQKMLAFHNKNTMNYYRASIKLKMQTYNTMLDMYGEQKQSNATMLQALNDIKKNSALPEAVKEQFSEEFLKMSRDKFLNKGHEALFGQGTFLSEFFKNIASSVKGSIGGVTDLTSLLLPTIESSIDQFEQTREMNEGMAGFGGPSTAEQLGGEGATSLMGVMGSFTRKRLMKTKYGKKLLDNAAKAGFAHDNMGQLLTKMLEDGSLMQKLLGKTLSENEYVGVLNDFLASTARSSLSAGKNIRVEQGGYGMYGRDDKRDLNSKALTSVIPSYLAHILREVTSLRTGNDNVDLLEYNYTKDSLVRAKDNARDVVIQAAGVDNIRAMASYRDSMMDNLGVEATDLTSEERRYVMTVITQHYAKGGTLEKEFFKEENFPLLTKEKLTLVKTRMAKKIAEDEDGETGFKTKITSISKSAKESMSMDPELLKGLVNTGNAQTLIRAGVMDSRGNINPNEFFKFLSMFDYEGNAKANEMTRNRLQNAKEAEFNQNKSITGAWANLRNSFTRQEAQREGHISDIMEDYSEAEILELEKGRSFGGGAFDKEISELVRKSLKNNKSNRSNKQTQETQSLFSQMLVGMNQSNQLLKNIDMRFSALPKREQNKQDPVWTALVDNTSMANDLLHQVVNRLDNLQIIQQMNMVETLPEEQRNGFFNILGRTVKDTARNSMDAARWGKDFTKRRWKGVSKSVGFMWRTQKNAAKLGWGLSKFISLAPMKAAWGTGKFFLGDKFGALKDGLKVSVKDRLQFGSDKAKEFIGKSKDKIVNLYDSATGQILISAEKLKKGQYFDEDGKIIRSISNIKGRVYDSVEKKYIEYEEIKNTFMDENGKFRPMKALGWLKEKAMGAGSAMFAAGTLPARLTGKAMGFGLKMMKKVTGIQYLDIYLPGQETPVLKASLFRNGAYFSAKTGEVIRNVKGIDSDVLDAQGNVIVSLKELSAGMVDRWGNPVGGFFRTNFTLAKEVTKKAIGTGVTMAKAAKNIVMGTIRTMKTGAMKMLRGSKNIVNQVLKRGKDALDAGVASALMLSETNTILANMLTLLDQRLPGKRMFGDKDGDGIIDNSFAVIKRKNAEKAKEKKEEKARQEDKKRGGLLGGLGGLLGGLFGKNKNEDEDEGGGFWDSLGGFWDSLGGDFGGGGGKDKAKTPKGPKPKGKAGLIKRLLGGGWNKAKGLGKGAAGLGGKLLGKLGLGKSLALAGGTAAGATALASGGASAATPAAAGAATALTNSPGWLGKTLGFATKFGGKRLAQMLPFAGAALSGTSAIDNWKQGNYMSAAVDGGFAAFNLFTSMNMIRGLANPYVAAGALGVGLLGYGAWKLFGGRSLGKAGHARFLLYGFDPDKFDHKDKILAFEDLMAETFKGSSVDAKNLPIDKVIEIFGARADDPEHMMMINDWITQRFIPVFDSTMRTLRTIDPSFTIKDADKLKDTDLVIYLRGIRPGMPNLYTSTVSPFKEAPTLTKTSEDAIVYIDEQLKSLDKSGKVAEAMAKNAGNAAVAGILANKGNGDMGGNSETMGQQALRKMHEEMDKNNNDMVAKAMGVTQVGKSVKVTSDGKNMIYVDNKPMDAYRTALYKIYGLEAMNEAQVLSVMNTEQELNRVIRWRGNEAYYEGDIKALTKECSRFYNIGLDDPEGMGRLQAYLQNRFIPVFLTANSVIAQNTNSWTIDTAYKSPPAVKKMAIDAAARTKGPNGVLVWEINVSPWVNFPLNTSMSSIRGDVDGIDKETQASSGSEAKAKADAQAGKSTFGKFSDWASSKWDEAKQRASSIWEAGKSWVTGQMDNVKEAFSEVANGGSVMDAAGNFIQNTATNAASAVSIASGSPVSKDTVSFAKGFTKGLRIGNLTEQQTAALAANTAETESRFRLGIQNKQGYSGLYQFGGEALMDIGLMRNTGIKGWRAQNNAMRNPGMWNNGMNLQKFLSDKATQDRAYVQLANNNIRYGRNAAGKDKAKFDSIIGTVEGMAKYLKMAHLKGPSAAVKGLLYGRDAQDGNGTSMIQYGNGAASKVGSIISQMGSAQPSGGVGSGLLAAGVAMGGTTSSANPMLRGGMDAGVMTAGQAQQAMQAATPGAGNMSGPVRSHAGATYSGGGGSFSGADASGSYAASVGSVAKNQNVPTGHRAYKAATHATQKALPKSTGYCARFVANALQAAGYKFARQGSAYMYARGPLAAAGFKQINAKGPFQIGDVMVWSAHGGKGGGGKHGHIQIFNGSVWVSDFKQRTVVPGRSYANSTPTLWRDSTLPANASGVSVPDNIGPQVSSGEAPVAKQDSAGAKSPINGNVGNQGNATPVRVKESYTPEEAAARMNAADPTGTVFHSNVPGSFGTVSYGDGSTTVSGGNAVKDSVDLIQGKIRGFLGMENSPLLARKQFEENKAVRDEAYKRANITTPAVNKALDQANAEMIGKAVGSKDALAQVSKSVENSKEAQINKDNLFNLMYQEAKAQTAELLKHTQLLGTIAKNIGVDKTELPKEASARTDLSRDIPKKTKANPVSMAKGMA